MQAALRCTQHLSKLLQAASKPTKTKGEIIQGLGNECIDLSTFKTAFLLSF